MKICLISMEYPPENAWTGIGTYTYNMSHALVGLGHEVHVFALALKSERVYPDGKVTVHRIKLTRPPVSVFTDPVGCILYSQKISSKIVKSALNFDVIEAPEWRAEGFASSFYFRRSLITRLHMPLFLLNKLSSKELTPADKIVNFLEMRQTVQSVGVTSSTMALKKIVCKHWRIDESQVTVIPNGLNIEKLRASATKSLIGSDYIVYVGQLEPRKGVHILAMALPLVFEKFKNLKVVFIGFDTLYNNISMKEFILKINAKHQKNLVFTGFVPEETKLSLIKNSKFVVLPSLWEAFGYTCLESMALGKAVIATKNSGFEEIIEDGHSGFLVEPGSHSALAKEILDCLLSEDKVQGAEKNAAKRVNAFDAKTVAQSLLKYYKKSLEERK